MIKRPKSDPQVVDHRFRSPLVGVQYGVATAVVVALAGAVVGLIWFPPDKLSVFPALLGTVSALLGVAVAATSARHEAATAARRAAAEREEHEREQARLVTVELSIPGLDDWENRDQYDFGVTITNHSDALVLEPRLLGFVHPRPDGDIAWEIADVPEHGEYTGPRTVLPAGDRDGLNVSVTFQPELEEDDHPLPVPVIAFTDAHGRRWCRFGASAPVRVRADPRDLDAARAAARAFQAGGPLWYRADR